MSREDRVPDAVVDRWVKGVFHGQLGLETQVARRPRDTGRLVSVVAGGRYVRGSLPVSLMLPVAGRVVVRAVTS